MVKSQIGWKNKSDYIGYYPEDPTDEEVSDIENAGKDYIKSVYPDDHPEANEFNSPEIPLKAS